MSLLFMDDPLEMLMHMAGTMNEDEFDSLIDIVMVDSIDHILQKLEKGILDLSELQQAMGHIEHWMNRDTRFKLYGEALFANMRVSPACKTYLRLAQRRALKLAEEGTADARRPPALEEGCQFAKVFLAGDMDRTRWETDWDRDILLRNGVDRWLSQRDLETLQTFIANSEGLAYDWDFLQLLCKRLAERGEQPPGELLAWHFAAVHGRRKRPFEEPTPRNRPRKKGYYFRNQRIRKAINYLLRVGMPPTGVANSGCRVVAEVMYPHLSEPAIRGIWKEQSIGYEEFIVDSALRVTGMPEA